ncbi:protocadherin gamma-B5-like isoform X8 [Rana temporaria]|uniref:protocadherin gamma-B5-like isoform X8 n=1 Tax=Rana temporaria TaxID=8407 RepID=UPI001AACBA84|nr:protocadherin gamma-B5-like isoform X8 [Rana temporaria]
MDKMKHHSQTYKELKWQVIISFYFSWLFHSVSGQIHYSIVEEMRKDSVIANIAKDLGLDIKQLSSRKLQIISHISEKYFYVNVNNGNLYVKDRIDRETLCGAAPTCFLTFDAVVENPINVFKVKIEIQDINDNPPVFYPEKFTIETIELASPGTRFALQNAEDLDIGVNSVQTYKLSDNSHFTLNQKISSNGFQSPELVLEKSLDQELQNVHELILIALDGGNPVRSGTAVIRIIVTDVNDNFPIFSQEVYKVSVNENSVINTTIINVNAMDRDAGTNGQITYSFSKTSENVHPSGLFSIHSKSGDININKMLDFEEATNYELSVQARDGGGLVSHCKVLIDIRDENDNAPEISIKSLSSPIPEDTAPGTVIALIRVHDKDSLENGEVDCRLTEETHFNLILSSDSFYTIVTTRFMDREKVSNYDITIVATDRGSPSLSSQKTIKLEISDVNDNPPLFIKSTYVAYVQENNLPGASIYSMQASDDDTGDNAKMIYSISNTNTQDLPVTSYFSLNIETGVIYAQRSFDYEQHKEFLIEVTARDNGHLSLSSNTTLIIKVLDQNDNAPKLLYPSPESGASAGFEMVPFGAEPGSLITKVVAVDADSGHNAWLSYHFIQVAEPFYFTIDEHTGEIRTQHVFQEKDVLNHKVVVMVRDNGIPSLSATVTITLVVANNFQQVVPKFVNHFPDEETQSNLQLYLVIALAVISLLFIITVMLTVISKCRKSKPFQVYGPVSSNLYPQVDPRMLSQYAGGTLTLPYSYNVCVALDSGESDFTYMKTNQNVPVDNLIDADDLGLGNESLKAALPTSSQIGHSQPNADWQLTQGQRPGPSGTQQPTEEPGVWPNNQFETERLQAMILASANEAAEGSSGLGGSTGTMGLSARYGPQFTLQHVPDYRQNIYIPGTTSTLTNAAGKRDNKAPSGNKKKSGKKEKK